MIILHGFYDNGKVTITDKNIPNIKAEIEIIIRKKSWQRKVQRVPLLNKNSASATVVQMRSEIWNHSLIHTSSLVKKYIDEEGSDIVTELFQNSDEVVLSPITKMEFQSALQRLFNSNFLTQQSYEIALMEFTEDSADYDFVNFNPTLEVLTMELIKKHGLRTLDGIQLASAKISDSDQFITSDAKLFEAAKKELSKKNIFV